MLRQAPRKETSMIVAQLESVLHSKTKWPLMWFGSSCAILAIRFSQHCSLFWGARNWGKILNPSFLMWSCALMKVSGTQIIGRHFVEAHGSNHLLKENQFRVLRKCQRKYECLVFEILFIKNLEPNLNKFSYDIGFYHPLLFWYI